MTHDAESKINSPLSFPGAESLAGLPEHVLRFRIAPGGCWIAEKRGPNGYAYNTSIKGKKGSQYRLIWEHLNGPVPEGLELDHLCNNGAGGCVNPFHLKACTHRENMLREGSQSFMAARVRQTHCVNGHEFTPENTVPHTKGKGRRCKTCKRDAVHRTLEKRRDEYRRRAREKYATDPRVKELQRARQKRARERARAEREAERNAS